MKDYILSWYQSGIGSSRNQSKRESHYCCWVCVQGFTYLNPHLCFQWQPLQDVNHDVTREMVGPDLEDQRMWLHKEWRKSDRELWFVNEWVYLGKLASKQNSQHKTVILFWLEKYVFAGYRMLVMEIMSMGNVQGYRENAIALIEVQEWIYAFLSLSRESTFIPHT